VRILIFFSKKAKNAENAIKSRFSKENDLKMAQKRAKKGPFLAIFPKKARKRAYFRGQKRHSSLNQREGGMSDLADWCSLLINTFYNTQKPVLPTLGRETTLTFLKIRIFGPKNRVKFLENFELFGNFYKFL